MPDDNNINPGSPLPSNGIPPVFTPSKPKGRFGRKKIILTILGLLLLVGGIGAGVILVQNNQDLRNRAYTPEGGICTKNSDCGTGEICQSGNCVKGSSGGNTGDNNNDNNNNGSKDSKKKSNTIADGQCLPDNAECSSGNFYQDTSCPDLLRCGLKSIADGQCLLQGEKCASDKSYFDSSCVSNTRCGTEPTSISYSCREDCYSAGGSGAECSALPSCTTSNKVADGKCLGPGQSCSSGKSYFDISCTNTETRCGTKTTSPTNPTTPGQCSRVGLVSSNTNSTSISITQAMKNACQDACSGANLYVAKYKCDGVNLSGGCQDSGQIVSQNASVGQSFSATDPTCGSIQIDVGCKSSAGTWGNVAFVSKSSSTACSNSSTPSPTGGLAAQCLNVEAYDTAWIKLTSADLQNLKAGDTVRFTVGGTATSGSFDKARFTINGTLRPEVTQKQPGTNNFYDEYTIPDGVTSFTVQAELHHSSLGWFGK
jgi:hypothetical protein